MWEPAVTKLRRALGLRGTPRGVHWAVVEGTQLAPVLVAHEPAEYPKGLEEPDGLVWTRRRLLDVIQAHSPSICVVRLAEPVGMGAGKSPAKQRNRMEGVLLEACRDRGLETHSGALATIAKKLSTTTQIAKGYVGGGDFRELKLNSMKKESREAVIAGIAGLPESET